MTQPIIILAGFIGAPVLAGVMFWRVWCGYAFFEKGAWSVIERAGIAFICGLSCFSGWLSLCERLLEASK